MQCQAFYVHSVSARLSEPAGILCPGTAPLVPMQQMECDRDGNGL